MSSPKVTTSLIAICSILAACAEDQPYDPADQFIVNTSVLDIVAGTWRHNQTLVVRDDSILEIKSAGSVTLPEGAWVVYEGGYVIPGLWDMHVHATSDADFATEYAFPLYMANGIIGIRDMGSEVAGLIETRQRLQSDPGVLAPEIVAAGPLLDGVKLPWYGDLPLLLESAADVRTKLPQLVEQGVDFFKVYDQLTPEVYEEVLSFAAESNMAVAGHPPRAVGITAAARAGQRSIEHLSEFTFGDCVNDSEQWFDRSIQSKFSGETYDAYYQLLLDFYASQDPVKCDQAINALSDSGTYVTPTLVMELNDRERLNEAALQFLEPGAKDWCDTVLGNIEGASAALRESAFSEIEGFLMRLYRADIPLLAGSDNPNNCLAPGFSLHWELERLVAAGLTETEALQTATLNVAKYLERESSEGEVKAGFKANLLVLEFDPLIDISQTQSIRGLFDAGQWIDQSGLEAQLTLAQNWVKNTRVDQ